jgi:hypothetical protein
MWRKSLQVSVLIPAVLWLMIVPGRLGAVAPQYAEDLTLVPLGGPGFVQLVSCVLVADLSCDGTQCVLRTQQAYQLYNRDHIKEASLRLGLAQVPGEAGTLSTLELKDSSGAALVPSAGKAQSSIWEVGLGRDEHKTLHLASTHIIPLAPLLRWRWETSRLNAWGTVEGLRVEFRQTSYLTDDAFLLAEPQGFALDGKRFLWEYESPQTLPRHQLVIISPPIWQQLQTARATGAHNEVARLVQQIQSAAQSAGVPCPDFFYETVAELQAALHANQGDTAARLSLAQVYQDRATAYPDMRLNYLLLAAQELSVAQKQRPEDSEIAGALSRAYAQAATLASEAGDATAALAYLRQAQNVPGTTPSQNEQQQIVSLRWALQIAEQGLGSQSWIQIQSLLSAPTQDILLRHAPPLLSAHTEIDLQPNQRTARYHLDLYAPSASKTQARVQELAASLNNLQGCQAAWQSENNAVVLTVQVAYRTVGELQQRADAIVSTISLAQDLVSALVVAPWQTVLHRFTVKPELGRDLYLYSESVDFAPIQETWAKEAEYVRWQLAELRNAAPTDERSQLEQHVAVLVLQEQRQVWERIPSGSYWVLRTTFPVSSPATPQTSWLISWGQARVLETSFPVWHIPRALLIIPPAFIILLLLVASVHRRRH